MTDRRHAAGFFGRPKQEAPNDFGHAGATRPSSGHGLANQIEVRSLLGTELPSAACGIEQPQQILTPTANLPCGTVREVKDHGARQHFGFERPDALFKFHRSSIYFRLSTAMCATA